MRSLLPRSLPVAAFLLLAACGSKSKVEIDGVTAVTDPKTVRVDDTGLSLDGKRLGDVPADVQKRVEPLWDTLRGSREAWKAAHPSEQFPGVLTIELGPNTTCGAAMSVYATAAFAGYTNLTLKQGAVTIQVPGAVPKPPSLDNPAQLIGPQEGFAVFQPDGNVEFKPLRCGGAYDVVPAASLAATVKEWCGEKADCLGAFHFRCAAGMPMSKVLPALEALRKGSAKMELGTSGECKEGEGAVTDLPGDPWGVIPTPPAVSAAAPGLGKKPLLSTVREGAVTATGGITADEARDALKPKLADLKACYDDGITRNPNLQGRVSVRLGVGKKGAVMTASNAGSDMPDSSVVACMIRAASTATFPAKGAIGWVVYPFVLSLK
jgi:hypothetical protein